MNSTHKLSYFHTVLILVLLTLLAAYLGLRWGSARLSLSQVIQGLLYRESEDATAKILWIVRLPRVAACLLAGCGLAVSGLLLQTATGNPLAGPNIIGVNAGAGFCVILSLCLFPTAFALQPLMAFAGAFGCTMVIVFVAGKAGGSHVTIVLAGVAVSALLSAGTSLIRLLYPDLSIVYSYFSVGGVSGVNFRQLAIPMVVIASVLACSFPLAGRLNLLCLGDSIAHTLGVRAKALRFLALILASASAAATVSFAGLLGFVGLMVPHMAKRLTGVSDLRKLLPAAALLGGTLVTFADLAGRVLFAPSEIPAGIITAILGAPFFFVLLLQRRNRT